MSVKLFLRVEWHETFRTLRDHLPQRNFRTSAWKFWLNGSRPLILEERDRKVLTKYKAVTQHTAGTHPYKFRTDINGNDSSISLIEKLLGKVSKAFPRKVWPWTPSKMHKIRAYTDYKIKM